MDENIGEIITQPTVENKKYIQIYTPNLHLHFQDKMGPVSKGITTVNLGV